MNDIAEAIVVTASATVTDVPIVVTPIHDDGGVQPMVIDKEEGPPPDADVEPLDDEDEDDEDYFDEEDLDEGFGRVVRGLPDLAKLKKGELGGELRLVDYRDALMSESESSDDDEEDDQQDLGEDDNEENVVDGDGDEKEGEGSPEEKNIIVQEKPEGITDPLFADGGEEDDLFFRGGGGSPRRGGRPQMRNLIESLQAHTGQLAHGYDDKDEFIDDSDVFRMSMDGMASAAAPEAPYAYGDFSISVQWKPARGKVLGNGKRKARVQVTPLDDFKPPLTSRVRNAIKALHSLGEAHDWSVANLGGPIHIPKHMGPACVELGRAVMEWHPSGHLKVSVLQHVADVFPFTAAKLKDRVKRATAKAGDDVPDSQASQVASQVQVMPSQEVDEENESSAPGASEQVEGSGMTVEQLVSTRTEYLTQLRDQIEVALESQLARMEASAKEFEEAKDAEDVTRKRKSKKVNTLFRWPLECRALMLSLDVCVKQEHSARKAAGEDVIGITKFMATHFKEKVIEMFPSGFMDKGRVTAIITSQRKRKKVTVATK